MEPRYVLLGVVVPIGVSGSLNAVAEFPNVVPIMVSGSPNVVSQCGPHWGVWVS